jgi:hypothetical protein
VEFPAAVLLDCRSKPTKDDPVLCHLVPQRHLLNIPSGIANNYCKKHFPVFPNNSEICMRKSNSTEKHKKVGEVIFRHNNLNFLNLGSLDSCRWQSALVGPCISRSDNSPLLHNVFYLAIGLVSFMQSWCNTI